MKLATGAQSGGWIDVEAAHEVKQTNPICSISMGESTGEEF